MVNEVSKLKQQLAGDIVAAASFQLVHTQLEHDLIDELRLMIYLVVLGTGHRLWASTQRTGQALNRMPSSAVVTDRNDIATAITDEIGGTDRPRCAVPRHRRLTWRPSDPGTSTWVTQPGSACSPSGLASIGVVFSLPVNRLRVE